VRRFATIILAVALFPVVAFGQQMPRARQILARTNNFTQLGVGYSSPSNDAAGTVQWALDWIDDNLVARITTNSNLILYTPYQLTSASTVTVSEAWTTNRFYLDLTNNVELAVSGVDTNKAAGWMLDVRLNSYSLSFGASITNLTNSDNFTRTNSYQSIVGNRPIFEAVTEVW